MTIQIDTMLMQTPGVCGGRLRIAGTRISVEQIAALDKQGQSVHEIIENCPYLTRAQVHAALAFYHANREEIDAALGAEEDEFDRLKTTNE